MVTLDQGQWPRVMSTVAANHEIDTCFDNGPVGCFFFTKDGSWNPMIFAHLSGQISADIETCPYCFVCEELSDHLNSKKIVAIAY